MISLAKLASALLLAALVAGCAGPRALSPPLPDPGAFASVELTQVPFFPQERYQCGPAALATVLGWSGDTISPEELVPLVYVPGRQGSLQPELTAQTRARGRVAYPLAPEPAALLKELQAGHPVLVLQNLGLSWWPVWHYAVVVGFDAERSALVLRSGTERRHLISLETFDRTWARGGRWGLLALPPDRLPATAIPAHWLKAAYDLERGGNTAAARMAYAAGLERWPADAGLALAQANLHYREGGLTRAAATLRSAMTAGADSGEIYNNLAVVLAELGRWDEAEAAARQALARDPGRGEFQRTLDEIRQRARSAAKR